MTEPLRYQLGDKTVQDLINLQEDGSLNLEPGFQRKSVWSPLDRRKLIQSILEGYPIPSIFLYKREEEGRPVYDVIDGKQRLETIFMFTGAPGFKRKSFEVWHAFLNDDDGECLWNWPTMKDWHQTAAFLGYRIQAAEVNGDLSDIVDLFVRINSTGKSLTSSEKRNARFYTSPFLKEAKRLARRHQRYLLKDGIVSQVQIDRMKDVELISEFLASIVQEGLIHKKAAVDRAVGNQSVNHKTLMKASGTLRRNFRLVRRLFPDLRSTRFRNTSEFYSLFMFVWELSRQKLVLFDRKRRSAANQILVRFSNGVDLVKERQKKAKGPGHGQRLYVDYLLQAQQATDNIIQRRRRAEILKGLFAGLFERKDERRLFSSEQRRIFWNSEDKKACRHCGAQLDWTNFQIDHVKAHSRGGRTELKNADLVCRSCNARKGARRRPRRRAA